jgi:hypothetical protein
MGSVSPTDARLRHSEISCPLPGIGTVGKSNTYFPARSQGNGTAETHRLTMSAVDISEVVTQLH